MPIGLVRKIRARKGCASGVHIKFYKAASKWDVEKALIKVAYYAETKARQGQWTLLDSVRYKWTGYLPWAGSYTETREQGLLQWWLKKKAQRDKLDVLEILATREKSKNDRSKLSKKNKRNARLPAGNKHGRKRNSGLKQRIKKVVRKQKRSNKRKKTKTV